MDVLDIVAERIRSARKDARLTQGAAAKKLGVSQRTWAAWENRQNAPSLEMIQQIAAMLDKEFAYFVVADYEYTAKAPLPKVAAQRRRS